MKSLMLCGVWLAATAALMGQAQERRANLDVEAYKIDARIDPAQQTLTATTQVTLTPLEDRVSTATFELNNALNLTTVTDTELSLIHISEPTRLGMISYAVFCLKKKNKKK